MRLNASAILMTIVSLIGFSKITKTLLIVFIMLEMRLARGRKDHVNVFKRLGKVDQLVFQIGISFPDWYETCSACTFPISPCESVISAK